MRHKSLRMFPREDEEDILPSLVAPRIKNALSKPPTNMSGTQMRRKLATITQEIRHLRATHREYVTADDIEDLADMIAEQTILRWRLFRINKLPVEILQRILVLAAFSVPCDEIVRARMILTSVCNRWRWAAFGTPELWSIIRINRGLPLPIVQQCLQLARAHPLRLIVDLRNPNWSGREHEVRLGADKLQPLMQFVAATLNRVCQLVIYADTWIEISTIEYVLHTIPPPPSLQRFELHRSGDSYVNFGSPANSPSGLRVPLRLFKGIRPPKLDHLTFDGVYVDFRSACFTNIRILEMRKMSVELMPSLVDFLAVLQGSPFLERLVFSGAGPKPPGWSTPAWQPVLLSRLFELELSDLVPNYCIFLTQLIHAPELRRLTFSRLRGSDYTRFFEKLIGRYPKVAVLTVNELDTTSVQVLAAWFRTIPLHHLRVARVPDEFFEALFPVMTQVVPRQQEVRFHVCPHLETCHVLDFSTINFAAFKKFCEARRGTLRTIVMSNSRSRDNEVRAWCKAKRATSVTWKEVPDPVHGEYYHSEQI